MRETKSMDFIAEQAKVRSKLLYALTPLKIEQNGKRQEPDSRHAVS
jgi:hypothetical protein